MANLLQDLSDAMASTVEDLTPAIVRVDARRRLPATGLIWSDDGIIVTAHHVVERDEDIHVLISDGDGNETRHAAELIGRDPQNDLAVLKVDATLTPPTWGDNDALRTGNLVLALGRPGEQVQATLGVVSALVSGSQRQERAGKRRGKRGRRRRGGGGMGQALVDGYIQTDVVMYPGFSGGPLVSGDGAIHGLNTSGFGRGVSVAVPVTTIRNTVNTLRAHGKMQRGYLGVGVQPVHLPEGVADELEQATGLLVVSVENASPAHEGGLLVGDIIVALDDESTETMDDLLASLTGERVGQAVTIQLVRGGELKEQSVTIGSRD